jgi:hypothetical protein
MNSTVSNDDDGYQRLMKDYYQMGDDVPGCTAIFFLTVYQVLSNA